MSLRVQNGAKGGGDQKKGLKNIKRGGAIAKVRREVSSLPLKRDQPKTNREEKVKQRKRRKV